MAIYIPTGVRKIAPRSGSEFGLRLALELGLGAIFLGGNFPRTMPTIYPFHSRFFINKTILFRKLSLIITRVFYFLEYIGDSEKARLFCRSFNQTGIIKRQIV